MLFFPETYLYCKRNASEIFQSQFAYLCDAVEANPLRIVNKLISAGLIAPYIRNDVTTMTGTAYDRANRIVAEIQRLLDADDYPDKFLGKICDFLRKRTDKTLKIIGGKMKKELLQNDL